MKTNELKSLMVLHGYTQESMAKELNMATNTFNRKLNNGEFGLDEAKKIVKLLNIDNPNYIFFDL